MGWFGPSGGCGCCNNECPGFICDPGSSCRYRFALSVPGKTGELVVYMRPSISWSSPNPSGTVPNGTYTLEMFGLPSGTYDHCMNQLVVDECESGDVCINLGPSEELAVNETRTMVCGCTPTPGETTTEHVYTATATSRAVVDFFCDSLENSPEFIQTYLHIFKRQSDNVIFIAFEVEVYFYIQYFNEWYGSYDYSFERTCTPTSSSSSTFGPFAETTFDCDNRVFPNDTLIGEYEINYANAIILAVEADSCGGITGTESADVIAQTGNPTSLSVRWSDSLSTFDPTIPSGCTGDTLYLYDVQGGYMGSTDPWNFATVEVSSESCS